MFLQISGALEWIGYLHFVFRLFAKVFFVNDEAAADRVIGFAINDGVASQRSDTHAVLVQRQVVLVEIHAGFQREIHFMLAFGQQQASTLFDVFNKSGDHIDINAVRHVARQAHNDSEIGVVAFTGE